MPFEANWLQHTAQIAWLVSHECREKDTRRCRAFFPRGHYVIVAFIGSFQNPKAINFLLCVVPPHCFSSHTLKISALRSDMYKPKRQSYSLQNKNEWEESITTIACCSCVLFVATLLLLVLYGFCCSRSAESWVERTWAAEVIFLLVLIWGELELSSSALKQWVTGTRK